MPDVSFPLFPIGSFRPHSFFPSRLFGIRNVPEEHALDERNDELKLPKLSNLVVILGGNVITQISFFIIVSSVSLYSIHLGGDETFSGLVLGIPTVCGGLALLPLLAYDGGTYRLPMVISYTSLIVGSLLYSLADAASFLYLILLGRMAAGIGYTSWLYNKRYCSDARVVGVRRRTLLSSWLVVGQGVGLTAGPFLGGVLYKIGFPDRIFNGYTSPGWIMLATFIGLTAASVMLFQDVPPRNQSPIQMRRFPSGSVIRARSSPTQDGSSEAPNVSLMNLSPIQKGVIFTMMWFSMLNFFILGSWEANIPIYTQSLFNYNPYNAGNFIALGGVVTFPALLLNVRYSRRFQDRLTLAFGSTVGLLGILIMLGIVSTHGKIPLAWYFLCWVLVAAGFNVASTCTLSLLSKQLAPEWNTKSSMLIQYSNYIGRVTGAVWGGAGPRVGQENWLGLQVSLVGIGAALYLGLWRELKAKVG